MNILTTENSTNLVNFLWEHSEDGTVYECDLNDINTFLQGEEQFGLLLDSQFEGIQIEDSETDKWLMKFITFMNLKKGNITNIPADNLKELIEGSLHQSLDGWTDEQK